jgi:hypothetical protein
MDRGSQPIRERMDLGSFMVVRALELASGSGRSAGAACQRWQGAEGGEQCDLVQYRAALDNGGTLAEGVASDGYDGGSVQGLQGYCECASLTRKDPLLPALRFQVDTVIRNVTAIAKEHKVLSWWRSAVSPHPECQQYDGRKLPEKAIMRTR